MIPDDEITSYLKKGEFKKAERAALVKIGSNRLDAQAWVYLGEALLRQNSSYTASQVFNRAHLLDPVASWVEAVNHEMKRVPSGNNRIDIEVLLETKKVTVAAALLVRNEILCIERCLKSIVNSVDEIVVIDCESTDGTREFVQSFPKVKMVTFAWCDDFAAARNAGLAQIESDWVIWIDADETLLAEDGDNIREIAGIMENEPLPFVLIGGVIEQIGERTSINYTKGRMFALKHNLRYWGRVHEQIGPSSGDRWTPDLLFKQVLVRFYHDGYSPEIMKDKNKLERNLHLLEMMLEDEPDNPAWLLYYGRETHGTGNVDKAVEILKLANEKAKLYPTFARRVEILMMLAVIHINAKELEEAKEYCQEALELRPDFPDALFYMGQIEINLAHRLYQSAELHLRQAKQVSHTYRGVVSPDRNISNWKADIALGDIARMVGKPADAKNIYESIQKRVPNSSESGKLALQRLNLIEEQFNRMKK
jgi:glycosyltransferase involved in cell wall biosynthesis